MLKIKDFIFQDDYGDRRSCLMFFKADRGGKRLMGCRHLGKLWRVDLWATLFLNN